MSSEEKKLPLYPPTAADQEAVPETTVPETGCPGGDLRTMTDNIPGGVYQCLADANLTMISMSNSFLELFGYNRGEIRSLFHDRFIKMIVPNDRMALMQTRRRNLTPGSTVEFEYRVRRKDGAALWILDKGKLVFLPDGTPSYCCILLDITDQKIERETLRLSLERHRIIMDQATDIIFEWDIQNDTLDFSSNWKKKFGYAPISEDISQLIPHSQHIHPEDMAAFLKIMNDTAAGVPYSETEFRICDVMGAYSWCRIRATTQYDGGGRPIKAVGVILDIDADKKQTQRLAEQARRDSLTNLLDKQAARQAVEELLCRSDCAQGVLFIIDLDDFKRINDSYGHLCGDTVLTDVAAELRRIFRLSDVVGRIGGDEFLAYLPGVAPENAAARGQSIVNAIGGIRVGGGRDGISCSVGGAVFPTDGQDFQTLYHCADLALYHIKNTGKNSFSLYEAAFFTQGNHLAEKAARTAVNAAIDSDEGAVSEFLAQYCFRMLYHAEDPKTTLVHMLKIIGIAYDLSRICILEYDRESLVLRKTLEWCADRVPPRADCQENPFTAGDRGILEDHWSNAGDGVCFCGDVRSLNAALRDSLVSQGVCSLLQCAVMDDGLLRGYVVFDECREDRRWTADQIETLTLTANVLSVFVLKLQLKERLNRLEHMPGRQDQPDRTPGRLSRPGQ